MERNGDNSCSVLGNLQEGRLGQVEVLEGRVAPPTVVVSERRVWRTKVCCSDGDGPREAPFGVVVASDLVARPTAQAIVEQSSA